ncbi:acyl carrier protein [Roseibium salinum]|nr:acyl carrier protein [Roseibium salinum]
MHEKTFVGNDTVRDRIADRFGTERPAAEAKPAASDAIRRQVISSLADDLMIDVADIREGDSFLDLGLDSILAVTWIRNLNRKFNIDLPATAVYAHPTVGALAAHVAQLAKPVDPGTTSTEAVAAQPALPEKESRNGGAQGADRGIAGAGSDDRHGGHP